MPYFQKWLPADTIWAQFTSNFADISWRVVDCAGRQYYSGSFNRVRTSKQFPDSHIYEAGFDCTFLPLRTVCFVELLLGGTATHVSEPMWCSPDLQGTGLVEYTNNKFHEGMIFETGFKPQYRVEFHLGRLKTGAKEHLFIDQSYDSRLISSKPYTAFEATFGNERGLPDYAIDKLNYIWSCNSVRLDGVEYSKESEAAFEMLGSDRYPMRSFKMSLLEGINRGYSIYDPTVNIQERLNVVYNIDVDVFGEIPVNNDSVIQVVGLE